jgi:hypothetical protein
MTLWFDRSRLADQDLAREYLSVTMLLSRADEVFTQPAWPSG